MLSPFNVTDPPDPVTDASVTIVHEGIAFPLEKLDDYAFITPVGFQLIAENTYTFEIGWQKNTHEYITTIEELPQIDIADLRTEDPLNRHINLNLIHSKLGTRYYLFKFFTGIVESGDTIWNDLSTDLSSTGTFVLEFGQNDDVIETGPWPVPIPEESDLAQGTFFKMEVHCINKRLFDYMEGVRTLSTGDLYSGYPTNPPFMFSNQAYGVVFNSAVTSVVYGL